MTNFNELSATWQQLHVLAPEAFEPIQNDEALKRATAFLRSLDAEIGERAGHPLASLADTVMHQVLAYEEEHFPIPDAAPHEMLAFYMEQRDLTLGDLSRATQIDKGNLSKIVRGERDLSLDNIRSLSAFLHVNPAVFL